LITAAHFKFTKVGIASVHNVNNFLKAYWLANGGDLSFKWLFYLFKYDNISISMDLRVNNYFIV